MSFSTKADQLALVKESIIKDRICSELAAGSKQLVFGSGDPDSEIVFVGEAPGKKEDESGLPFVGRAGNFLNQMLELIALDRSKVYITNIVKYRPPNNRDPLPEEKREFLPYLQRQLEIIRPRLVVALGRHAGSCFMPHLIIGQDHGKAKRIALNFSDSELKIVFLPLFHPAAALYNGSMKQTLIDDFMLIPKIMELDILTKKIK